MDVAAGLGLERVARLVAGPVSFDPSRQRLALAAGDPIRVLGPDGKLIEQWSLGAGVRDLRFGPDGSLWVLGREGLVHATEGNETCRAADLNAEQILGVGPTGTVFLSQVQGMETGVWGALLTVTPDCQVKEGELRQPVPTAMAWTGDLQWVGFGATMGAGPSRRGPPRVEGPINPLLTLFEGAPDALQVADLVVDKGLLGVADTGAWELWSLNGPRKVAQGKAGTASVEAVPGAALAAVGADLVGLQDGAVTTGALPAPVVAISPDGALWVLGLEEERALWRRAPARTP